MYLTGAAFGVTKEADDFLHLFQVSVQKGGQKKTNLSGFNEAMKNIEVKEEQFSQVKICSCFKSQHLHQYAKKIADDMWESSGEIRDCHRKVEVFLWRPVLHVLLEFRSFLESWVINQDLSTN